MAVIDQTRGNAEQISSISFIVWEEGWDVWIFPIFPQVYS